MIDKIIVSTFIYRVTYNFIHLYKINKEENPRFYGANEIYINYN